MGKKWGHMKFCYETTSLMLNTMFIAKEKKLLENKKFSNFSGLRIFLNVEKPPMIKIDFLDQF